MRATGCGSEGRRVDGDKCPTKGSCRVGGEISPYATAPMPRGGLGGETSVKSRHQVTTLQLPTVALEERQAEAGTNIYAMTLHRLSNIFTSSPIVQYNGINTLMYCMHLG